MGERWAPLKVPLIKSVHLTHSLGLPYMAQSLTDLNLTSAYS